AVIADSLTPGITYTAKDSRDDQDYTVAKLADGNVWMTKNLNLAGGTTITPADSNVAENYTLPANSTTTTSGFSEVANFANTDCNGMQPCYSYYNWYVSTANTNPSDGVIKNDICAKGWKIPTAKNWLSVANGGSILSYENSILHITRNSLFYTDGNFRKEDNRSQYWASCDTDYCTTVQGNVTDYYLGPNWSGLNSSSPRTGDTVRCIFDRSMQNFSATDAAAMEVGQTITLVDNRDNQEYTVAKLPDGKVWMTKNLNLAGGTALTSDNTNMAAGYVMPTSVGFQDGNKLPESSMQGFDNNDRAFVYNSGGEDCESETGCYSYYSWHAATLGSVAVDDGWKTAPYDICPKGWRMPTAQLEDTSLDLSYDFSRLSYSINGGQMIIRYTSSTNPTYLEMFSILRASPYLFVGSGNIKDSVFTESMLQDAMYWSAYAGQIGNRTASFVWPIHGSGGSSMFYGSHTRQNGKAVRCLFAG
ncbi:hypothetical protein IJG29_00355, partial [Candidatus Saccharibacteria bacterium]|nr:hypothetical protein [Candidatus Saccharibacteria bacterium]